MSETQEVDFLPVENVTSPTMEFHAPQVEPAAQNSTLSPLVQAVMNGQLTTDQMRDMLDIQATFERLEAKKAYNHAMAQFKAHAPTLKKNKTVEYTTDKGKTTRYNHVELGYALSEITPILSNFGLSLSWKTTQDNGQVIVTAYVTHELGHSETNTLMAAPDSSGGKNGIQSIVSATTYLKRSTGLSLLGLEGTDDDDGNGYMSNVEYITEEQLADLMSLVDEVKPMEKAFFSFFKIKEYGQMPAKRFNEAVKMLEKMRNRHG